MKSKLLFLSGLLLGINLLYAGSNESANRRFAASGNVKIYAFRYGEADSPSAYKAGPVSFDVGNVADVTLIDDQTALGRIYAGEYVNYKWYAVTTKPGFQSTPENLAVLDLQTGVRSPIARASGQLYDMAYDYTTHTMYGILSQGEALATIDLKTGKVEKVADITGIYAMTLACDLSGQLYTVATDGGFYKLDKANAACHKVGNTGVSVAYTQTMNFDHNTRVLYWHNAGDAKLYTIDISTGVATPVGRVEAGAQLSSLFVPYIRVNAGAPDRVLARQAVADRTGAAKVVLTWKNPAYDAQGNPLTDLTSVNIYRDGTLRTTVSAGTDMIGREQTWTDESVSEGRHVYEITAVNGAGEGGKDDEGIMVYVGEDIPGAVNNFRVVSGDNAGVLSWSAPVVGGTGGFYRPENLSGYKIVRSGSTDTITVTDPEAVSYTDNAVPQWGKYTYTILAYNRVGKGIEVQSPEVLITPSEWIVMREGEYAVTDGTFYDTGGPEGNYRNSERIQMTLKPAVSGNKLVVSFTSLAIDSYGDYLEIYNGTDRSAPCIGKFTGTSVPESLKNLMATNAEGALTFYFYSDVYGNEPGWEATVTSYEVRDHDLAVLSLSGDTEPAAEEPAGFHCVLRNIGGEAVAGTDYKVRLVDNGDNRVLEETEGIDLASMTEDTLFISFTPQHKGMLTIKAVVIYAEDQVTDNNESDTLALQVQPKGTKVVKIGNNVSSSIGMFPLCFLDDYSLSQTLYTASLIGVQEGRIKQIRYPASVTTAYTGIDIKIWIGETENEDLSDGNLPVSGMTLVYEGEQDIPVGKYDWSITLDHPYEYTGKNLVITMSKGGANASSMGVLFQYAMTDTTCTWAASDYEKEVDPNVRMENYCGYEMVPDIRMLIGPKDLSGIPESPEEEISVYPVPFDTYLHIRGHKDIKWVKITDLSGKTVLSGKPGVDRMIPTSGFDKGIYFISVESVDGSRLVRKIIKK